MNRCSLVYCLSECLRIAIYTLSCIIPEGFRCKFLSKLLKKTRSIMLSWFPCCKRDDDDYQRLSQDEEQCVGGDEDRSSNIQQVISKNKYLEQRTQQLEDQLKQKDEENLDLKKSLNRSELFNAQLSNEKRQLDNRLQEFQKQIHELQKEKSEALTRLSKLMGNKLADNNPAITNLNDPNRPMKLGEQFSELYENEWTDAFSELTGKRKIPERESVDVLVQILKEVNRICMSDVQKQEAEIKPSGEEGRTRMFETLKDNAAARIPLLTQNIFGNEDNKYITEYRQLAQHYIEGCVRICYFAAVQNPRMVLDFEPGQEYNKQAFKEYTKSGTMVDYLVWPALYLFEGGSLLAKGVVQPI